MRWTGFLSEGFFAARRGLSGSSSFSSAPPPDPFDPGARRVSFSHEMTAAAPAAVLDAARGRALRFAGASKGFGRAPAADTNYQDCHVIQALAALLVAPVLRLHPGPGCRPPRWSLLAWPGY